MVKYKITLLELMRVAKGRNSSRRTLQAALRPGADISVRTALALLRNLQLAGAVKTSSEQFFHAAAFQQFGQPLPASYNPGAMALLGSADDLAVLLAERAIGITGIGKGQFGELRRAFADVLREQFGLRFVSLLGKPLHDQVSLAITNGEIRRFEEDFENNRERLAHNAQQRNGRRSVPRDARRQVMGRGVRTWIVDPPHQERSKS